MSAPRNTPALQTSARLCTAANDERMHQHHDMLAHVAMAQNALSGALHLVRQADIQPATIHAATGRANRALTLLKRASQCMQAQ